MTIDFLAGCLSCKQENCSLAWLRVVKKRKSAKCHLQMQCASLTPHTLGAKESVVLLPGAAAGIGDVLYHVD